MKIFKTKNGIGLWEGILYLFIVIGLVSFLNGIIDGYLERQVIILAMIVYIVICLYYIFLNLTLIYIISDTNVEIKAFFGLKKITIPFNEIEGFVLQSKEIKGFKLSGFGKNRYCFGRSVIDKVGLTRMFVTNSSKVIYLHTDNVSYGLSPIEFNDFKNEIISKNIEEKEFKAKINKGNNIFRDKSVYIPFISVSIIIMVIIIIPFLLYMMRILPQKMPLAFDAHFIPTIFGSGKEFAFKQMIYGVLNMILLVCMYYAAHFCAKYDRRLAHRYIYISVITAVLFLIIQIQILIAYL